MTGQIQTIDEDRDALPADDRANSGYRVMPHNMEAEQALLGALLVNNAALEKVSDFLRPEHFYNPAHGRIYEVIGKMTDRGQEANPVTLKEYFHKDEELEHVGGGGYLAELARNVVNVVNVYDYGRTIYELHLRRALIALGEDVCEQAMSPNIDLPASTQIEQAEQQLFNLAAAGETSRGFVKFSSSLRVAIETAEKAYKNQGKITGVTTGLSDIDAKLGGLHNSDLLIVAGRPSMGKTVMGVNIAFNAARRYLETGGQEGAVAAVFSLEMSAEQLAARILADIAEVPSDKIRRGDLMDSDFQKFIEASRLLSSVPLFVDDTPALTISAVRTRARRLKRTENLGLIVVDYLQLLYGSGRGGENRVQEISEITRGLKAIAKELHVPVVALSQLSRAVESRENKRPQLSDLRESGSIEQDADVVMFLYREEYYLEREEPARRAEETEEKFNDRYEQWQQRCAESHNIAECIVAKQRHGPIGTVRLYFEGQYTRFSDLDTFHDSSR